MAELGVVAVPMPRGVIIRSGVGEATSTTATSSVIHPTRSLPEPRTEPCPSTGTPDSHTDTPTSTESGAHESGAHEYLTECLRSYLETWNAQWDTKESFTVVVNKDTTISKEITNLKCVLCPDPKVVVWRQDSTRRDVILEAVRNHVKRNSHVQNYTREHGQRPTCVLKQLSSNDWRSALHRCSSLPAYKKSAFRCRVVGDKLPGELPGLECCWEGCETIVKGSSPMKAVINMDAHYIACKNRVAKNLRRKTQEVKVAETLRNKKRVKTSGTPRKILKKNIADRSTNPAFFAMFGSNPSQTAIASNSSSSSSSSSSPSSSSTTEGAFAAKTTSPVSPTPGSSSTSSSSPSSSSTTEGACAATKASQLSPTPGLWEWESLSTTTPRTPTVKRNNRKRLTPQSSEVVDLTGPRFGGFCNGFGGSVNIKVGSKVHKVDAKTVASKVFLNNRDFYTHDLRRGNGEECIAERCVRAIKCYGSGEASTGVCPECSALGSHRGYQQVARRIVTPVKNKENCGPLRPRLTLNQVLQGKKFWKKKALRLLVRLKAEQMKSTFERQLPRTTGAILCEQALRGDLKSVGTKLRALTTSGALLGQKLSTALTIASDIVNNMLREPKGRRHSQRTRALQSIVRMSGGRRLYSILTENGIFGSERQARYDAKSVDNGYVWTASMTDADFKYVADLMRAVMIERGMEGDMGRIGVSLSEDETALRGQLPQWDPQTNEIRGLCGPLCARKCTHIKDCRQSKCKDEHSCDVNGFRPKMNGTYEQVKTILETNRASPMGRLVMLVPLHSELPAVPLVWMGTCNTTTARDYSAPQMHKIEKLFNKHISPVLGPCFTRGSDGDPRRRMTATMSGLAEHKDCVWIEGLSNFLFGGAPPTGEGLSSILNIDQDYYHCSRKLVNNTASPARDMVLGRYTVALVMLSAFMGDVPTAEHGAASNDIDRKGYRATDQPSVDRLISKKFRNSLQMFIDGKNTDGSMCATGGHPELVGMHSHLTTVYKYMGMFQSETMSLKNRVFFAGFVMVFYLVWMGFGKEYVRKWNSRHDTKRNPASVTREALTDIVFGCHLIPLLIKRFRDFCPDKAIPFPKMGSNECENMFAACGSFIMNKRTYTECEGLQNMRCIMRSQVLSALHSVSLGSTRKKPGHWKEDETLSGDQLNWPTDVDIAHVWNDGCKAALDELKRLGCKPRSPLPSWWTDPGSNMTGLPSKADATKWWQSTINGKDYGRDDVNAAIVGGLSEEQMLEEHEQEVDTNNESGEEGKDEDVDSSDEIGAEPDFGAEDMETSWVRGDTDNKHDDDGASDRVDLGVIVQGLEEMLAGTDEGEGDDIEEVCVLEPKIKQTMWVPGFGEVHKAKICAWFNSGVETVSNDRKIRAVQAASTIRAKDRFNIVESVWTVQIGHDIAVLYDPVGRRRRRANQVKDAFIGRISRIRRRVNNAWVEYVYPVDLSIVKEDKLDLRFTCCWYKAIGRVGQYSYGNSFDNDDVHLECVICPVVLSYDPDTKVYVLPEEVRKILERNEDGDCTVPWEQEEDD
jgi:hypothetical protein